MASVRQLSPQPIVVEAVVLASMALTTLAVGTGLYLHAGFDLMVALALALAAYAGMLVTHGLLRRFLFGGTVAQADGREGEDDSDISEDLARRVAEALSSLPREEVATPPASGGVGRAHGDGAGAVPFGRRTSVPKSRDAGAPDAEPINPSATTGAVGAAAGGAEPPMTAPPAPSAQQTATARPPAGGKSRSSSAPGMPELPAARYTPAPERAVPPPSPPQPADVEMIQALIRKLADEVNAANLVTAPPVPTDAGEVDGSHRPYAHRDVATDMPASADAPPPVPAVIGDAMDGAVPTEAGLGDVQPAQSETADIDALRRAAETMQALEDRASSGKGGSDNEPAAGYGRTGLHALASASPKRFGRIRDAVAAGRVDVLLDPVVGLEDSKARHFEVSVRLLDDQGIALDVEQDGEALRGTGVFPLVDQAKLERTSHLAQRLRARGKTGAVFTRTSGESLIADPFLDTFADAYRAREAFSSQLIMTFSQADVRAFGPREWATLADMADLGFGFAIASVSDLDMDFEELAGRGFKFLKLDAGVFLEGLPAGEAFVPAEDICRHVAALGMSVIVGEIASEAIKARIFGFGVLFGQGALFGGPRLVKADAVAPRDGHNGVEAA